MEGTCPGYVYNRAKWPVCHMNTMFSVVARVSVCVCIYSVHVHSGFRSFSGRDLMFVFLVFFSPVMAKKCFLRRQMYTERQPPPLLKYTSSSLTAGPEKSSANTYREYLSLHLLHSEQLPRATMPCGIIHCTSFHLGQHSN